MKNDKIIIFLGNPVAECDAATSRVHDVNIADNIAQNTVIKGLNERYGNNLVVISVFADKKATPDIDLGYGIKAQTVASNNRNVITYYLSAMVNYTKKLNALMKHFRDKDVLVITNGPYIYRALPVLIAKWRYKNVTWVPFLIGAIEVPEAKFPFSLISKLSRWTVKRADGAITYVAKSVIDYMPRKPFVEIVYLIDTAVMKMYKDHSKKNKKFTIAYTGALTSIYNIDIIVEVIRRTGMMYHWVFAGGGQYAKEIEALSKDDRYDVEYLGKISNSEAIKLQKSSHLLLCLKGGAHTKINQYYSKYAASGKLTEYLCSGTPILAGDIPAFSEKIRPFATFEKRQTVDQIINDLAGIKDDYADKTILAKRGQEHAFKYFNAEYQNKKIYEFLESL